MYFYIVLMIQCIFFFNDTATTEIYTLSLHDSLPIFAEKCGYTGRIERDASKPNGQPRRMLDVTRAAERFGLDRKSTRLNSSHANMSYAVFCLKKINTYLLKIRIIYRHSVCNIKLHRN